ncbi:MAG: response regulator [Candidatus Competibacterales bacterium]
MPAPPRLLLIDDDQAFCELLRDYFKLDDFAVEFAHDGISGLQLARSGTFDLAILDVMLPAMSGFEVLRHLREDSPLPVLMLTARGDDIDCIVGLETGADDYIAKPCNPRQIAARVRAI